MKDILLWELCQSAILQFRGGLIKMVFRFLPACPGAEPGNALRVEIDGGLKTKQFSDLGYIRIAAANVAGAKPVDDLRLDTGIGREPLDRSGCWRNDLTGLS